MLRSALLLASVWIALFGRTAAAGELLTVLAGPDHATPVVLQAMEQAADAALAPGITVTWKTSHEVEGHAVSTPLAIIRLRGQCRPQDGLRWLDPDALPDGQPLGQTYISNGHILPIADVLCDNVVALIGPNLRIAPPGQRDGLLGLALGRVIAHELFHIMLKTTLHSREGLFRSTQRSTDLLARRDSFSDLDQRKLEQVEASAGPPRERPISDR